MRRDEGIGMRRMGTSVEAFVIHADVRLHTREGATG
jgi:hypothetical protein